MLHQNYLDEYELDLKDGVMEKLFNKESVLELEMLGKMRNC